MPDKIILKCLEDIVANIVTNQKEFREIRGRYPDDQEFKTIARNAYVDVMLPYMLRVGCAKTGDMFYD
jgi:hypothetical protein